MPIYQFSFQRGLLTEGMKAKIAAARQFDAALSGWSAREQSSARYPPLARRQA